MEDFFESIASFRSYRQLRAAWVIEGEGAGAKALFARDGEHYTQICRDSAFSQACAAVGRRDDVQDRKRRDNLVPEIHDSA